jgi:hypothetical protein
MPNPGMADLIARRGLTFPERTRSHLRQVGIWCDPNLSVEELKWMAPVEWRIRGKECGGATAEIGRYVGFCREDGSTLPWLQRVRNFMPNGIHAIVLAAESLVRLDMYRYETSYDLLITRHWLHREGERARPKLWHETLFFARYGILEWELWGKDRKYRGGVAPRFLGRNGLELPLPESFRVPIFKMVEGVTEIGCHQPHLLEAPMPEASQNQDRRPSGSNGAEGVEAL